MIYMAIAPLHGSDSLYHAMPPTHGARDLKAAGAAIREPVVAGGDYFFSLQVFMPNNL